MKRLSLNLAVCSIIASQALSQSIYQSWELRGDDYQSLTGKDKFSKIWSQIPLNTNTKVWHDDTLA